MKFPLFQLYTYFLQQHITKLSLSNTVIVTLSPLSSLSCINHSKEIFDSKEPLNSRICYPILCFDNC